MTGAEQGILILYNVAGTSDATAEHACVESVSGVLAELHAVTEALDKLRIPHRSVGVGALRDCIAVLARAPERVAINLVEGFDSGPDDATLLPALCHAFGKECTGADTACLALALDKGMAKAVLVQAGLQRHPIKRWRQLQMRMGRIDRMIKSSEPGNRWDELLQLALIISGTRVV